MNEKEFKYTFDLEKNSKQYGAVERFLYKVKNLQDMGLLKIVSPYDVDEDDDGARTIVEIKTNMTKSEIMKKTGGYIYS